MALQNEETKAQFDNKRKIADIQYKPQESDIVTIEPDSDKFSAIVIWLHGLGDRGQSWKQSLSSIANSYPHIKWLFPTAATAPVTLYGFRSTTWHNIVSLTDWEANKEFLGRAASVQFVQQLIETQMNEHPNIPANRILLGGFSQGAAIGLYTALTVPFKVAGVVCLSGYFPDIDMKNINREHTDIAILMYHCKADAIVNYKLANIAYDTLKNEYSANNIELKFNGAQASPFNNNGHCTTPKEMRDVAKFIGKQLPNENETNSGTFCVLL